MFKKTTMFLLAMIILMPIGVNAGRIEKKLVDVEGLEETLNFRFAGRINTDYSNFVLAEYDYEIEEFILYRYDWNKNRTMLPSDFDDDNLEYGEYEVEELDYVNVGGAGSYDRTLTMEEDPLNEGSYRYYTSYEENREIVSNYIYSSATKGESLGCVLESDEFSDLYVYQLLKSDGGADYVTDSGRIIFSTEDNNDINYTLINHDIRVNTFKNNTNIIITYYDERPGPRIISKFSVASLKSLLQTDDLEGIKITSNLISTAGDEYIEVELNNYVYFINPTATKILYEKEIDENKEYEFYGMSYNNKDYIFFDLYETSPYHQILTEVFDLERNSYYEDNEWINLYFTRYGALFGIEKIDNKYYAVFINVDGFELYRKDITDAEVGGFYYNFYGEILTADHETTKIDVGKYLLYFYNDRVDDNQYFTEYEIMSVLNSYSVVKGANQNYTLGSNKNATFKINANNNLFDKVYINDVELAPSNYTITKGSTIVTLLSEYLNTLKNGTYDLTVTFTNNEMASTQFIVNKAVINPETSDLIISYGILGSMSLIILFGTSLYLKKKRYN